MPRTSIFFPAVLAIGLVVVAPACSGEASDSSAAGDPTESSSTEQPLTAKVTQRTVPSDPPNAKGGDIPLGTYELVSDIVYAGAGGTSSTGPSRAVRLVVRSGTMSFRTAEAGVVTLEDAAYTFCGAGLGLTYQSGPNVGTVKALSYDGGSNRLRTFDGREVRTYALVAAVGRNAVAATGAACENAPGVCGGLRNVANWVTEQTTTGPTPVGSGGTILTDVPFAQDTDVYYNGAQPNGKRDRLTLIMRTGGTFDFVEDIDANPILRLSGTYTTSGNVVTYNVTCSPFGSFPLPFQFDATASTFATIQPGMPNHNTGTEKMTYHAVTN